MQSLQVLAKAEDEELVVLVAPVRLDSLEDSADGRPAKLRDVDGSLLPGNLLAVEPEISRVLLGRHADVLLNE